jgi:uncharacterized LabA/DUF88 family protein
MKKVAVYIDGFNLYHSIKRLNLDYLKWLNLRSLSEKFIDPKTEIIDKIYYFSAFANHLNKYDSSKVVRHKIYVRALSNYKIDFIEGKFKTDDFPCSNSGCNKKLIYKEVEKETDVNFAIYFIKDVMQNNYDKYVLMTNDTDQAPSIKMAKTINSNIKIEILVPPTYEMNYTFKDILKIKEPKKINKTHLERSLLPNEIIQPNGKIIRVPPKYKK